MLFNSISYLIFLPIVFIIYWNLKSNLKFQNLFLLLSSYFFYAFWDYRFLFLLVFSTALNYFTGKMIYTSNGINNRKIWLFVSVIINLGFLGVFKYYNFFLTSFVDLFSFFGLKTDLFTLKLILPVGISFYTFHGLSYIIDIYKNRIKPIDDFVSYSVFVSFFPLLVAGPIERATHLLPQITTKREINYNTLSDGLRQILWGLVKKIIIADSCAFYVNTIFSNFDQYNGSSLFLGAILFAIQIYGDFSGYSDIALGSAKLLGFSLLRNFSYPYFSRDIAEFWRRWHISLSSWFRDYVYIPLGGSKAKLLIRIRNTFLIFLLSGFWHGANWTFIFWGLLNAVYFLPLLLLKINRNNSDVVASGRLLPTIKEFIQILSTFLLTTFAWIVFRSNTLYNAFEYIKIIFSKTFFEKPLFIETKLMIALFIFILVEWLGRECVHPLQFTNISTSRIFRWSVYYILLLCLYLFRGTEQTFIYFSF
jgi:alginate O-acetyltransferase complex protein AlgI